MNKFEQALNNTNSTSTIDKKEDKNKFEQAFEEFKIGSKEEETKEWRDSHYPVKEYIMTEEQLRFNQNQNWNLFQYFNYAGDKWDSFSTRLQNRLLETWKLPRDFVEQTIAGKRKPKNL